MLDNHVLHNRRSSGTHSELIYNYIKKKHNIFLPLIHNFLVYQAAGDLH